MRICDDDGNLQYIKYTRFLKDDDSTDDESSDEEVNENDTIYENDISDTQQDEEELEDIYDFQQVGEYLMECAQEENLDETCHSEEDFLTEQELLTPRIESLVGKGLTNSTPAVVAQATYTESCLLKTTLAKFVSKVFVEKQRSKNIRLNAHQAQEQPYKKRRL